MICLQTPKLLDGIQKEFEQQSKDHPYKSFLPEGAKPPLYLNRELMRKYRDAMMQAGQEKIELLTGTTLKLLQMQRGYFDSDTYHTPEKEHLSFREKLFRTADCISHGNMSISFSEQGNRQ